METTNETLRLEQWGSEKWKMMNIPTSFIWIIIFFDEAQREHNTSPLKRCLIKAAVGNNRCLHWESH
jgi:hypothetical protein